MTQGSWLERAKSFFTRSSKPSMTDEELAVIIARQEEYQKWFSRASNLVKEMKGCAIRSQWAKDKLNAACDESVAHPTNEASLLMVAAAFAAILLSDTDAEEGFVELESFMRHRTDKLHGVSYIEENVRMVRAITALKNEGLYHYHMMAHYPERFFDDAPEISPSDDGSVPGS